MQIFSRYVFRQTASALLLIVSALSGIVWIALALRQLKVVTSSGSDAWTLIAMTTLALPNLFAFIAPVALLIACLHVLNRLNSDSELIILTASGATIWQVGRPLLLLAVIVAAGVAYVNFHAMPAALKQLRYMVIDVRTNLISQVLEPGAFTSPVDGVTIHMREQTLTGEMRGVLFHDARNPEEVVSVTAARAELVMDGEEAFLQMFNGHIVRQPGPNAAAQLITFESYALSLDSFQRKESKHYWKTKERYLSELTNPEPDDPRFKDDPGSFRAEIHERFSSCLYPIAFVMIALAFMGQAQSTRTNRTQAVMGGFALAALSRLVGLGMNKLVVLDASAVPLMYAPPVLAVLLSAIAIYRNERPVPVAAWRRELSFQLEDTSAAIRRRLLAPFARQQPGE